jgi:hypothetical protein
MMRKSSIIEELENIMEEYLANVTDEQLLKDIEEAHNGVYGFVDVPVLEMCSEYTRRIQ